MNASEAGEGADIESQTWGKKFLDEFPAPDTIFTMNARCQHEGCQGSRFRTNELQNIICTNCGTHQEITLDCDAHFWATRIWRPLAHQASA